MPLQKLPPSGPQSVSTSTGQRPQLQDRRRTLQTISELSTNDGGLPDFVSSIGIGHIRRLGHDTTPGVGRTTPKPVKRQSLPQHHSSLNIHVPRPSITVTPAYGHEVRNSRLSQGRRPMPITTDQVEGWNAKRERARMQHEVAIIEARVRQSMSDQGAEIATSPVRPGASSRPTSIKHAHSMQTLLEKRNSGSERHTSLVSTINNASQFDTRPEASERASTDSSSYQSRDSAINRSRSGSSSTSYASQDAPPLPHGSTAAMKGYCAELILQNQNLVSFGESARSKNLNPNRSSRTHSLTSDGLKHTSVPHHRYMTAPDLRHPLTQQSRLISAQRARNQALAALTAANNHMRPTRENPYSSSQYSSPHQDRHASLTSHPPDVSAHRKSASPHRNSLRYQAQLETQRRITSPSPARFSHNKDRGSLHRHSDVTRKVSFETRTVPKRESLTQWKKEREEAKPYSHMDHKARIQERVRRANELEQEREKELVSMGKRQAKSESRSCFGGLFAVLRGKST
ncbi:uncharacterized protein M421DRAFT_137997 [Didymella exigua CBS 183.55]|uniref:Uncharacterized protein n=1 Tax=Didymella exigua CBS 183.55 TaxID=1150837 RepID=A0A6A5RLT3_9PLEO|nr:uncharacterized protein M421DRAFT_137997 [Didymella exigua CBS 183.55]KAF1929385.1 hypothetical protein M421DRAFT_137997 [Didymella exigua CBS 183.55]